MQEKFNKQADAIDSLLCVGLDSDWRELPEELKRKAHPQFEFNKSIIAETAKFAAAYKLNTAFYEARGSEGYAELKMTLDFLQNEHPDIFTIADSKRGDTEHTNRAYAESIFDWFGFDAATVNPYMGRESLEPFLKRTDKISIILCRTSNPGAREIQDLVVADPTYSTDPTDSSSHPPGCGDSLQANSPQESKPLWRRIAEKVVSEWNENGNCMLVVGATYPEEMKEIRNIAGDMTFLVPGIGAQDGNIEAVMRAGINREKKGLIISSSRGIIFTEHPGEEAKRLRDSINRLRL